jgi:RNA polymerase sigma-70 factor (ECF subfamily)
MERKALRHKDHEKAFQLFYESNYAAISHFVARRLPMELHDDVVADTFLAAWRKFDSVPEPSPQWLYKIARFEISHARRRSAVQRRIFADQVVEGAMSPSQIDRWIDVASALDKIPESDAEIIRLVLWDGAPRDMVAEILGCSVNTATVRYHRALMRLREVLDVETYRPKKMSKLPKEPGDDALRRLRER